MLMAVPHFRPSDFVIICGACRKSFPTRAEVLQHLSNCIDPKLQRLTEEQVLKWKSPPKKIVDLESPICKFDFVDMGSLNLLKTEMHIPKTPELTDQFSCDTPNSPPSLESVQNHNTDSFECQLCGKVFQNDSNCQSHTKKHRTSTKGVFKCLYRGCFETFPDCALKQHTEQHKSVECDDCGKFLPTLALLASHRKRHTLEMPGFLNCLYLKCRSLCINSKELKLHMVQHTLAQSQYFCCKCNLHFLSLIELNQHRKIHFHIVTPKYSLLELKLQQHF